MDVFVTGSAREFDPAPNFVEDLARLLLGHGRHSLSPQLTCSRASMRAVPSASCRAYGSIIQLVISSPHPKES